MDIGAEQSGGDEHRPESQFADTLRALSETQAELREASGIPNVPQDAASAAFSDPIFQGYIVHHLSESLAHNEAGSNACPASMCSGDTLLGSLRGDQGGSKGNLHQKRIYKCT